jgi:cell division protein FtsQ
VRSARATVLKMPERRGPASVEDYSALDRDDSEVPTRLRRPGVRVNFSGGLLPHSLWGRIAAGGGLVVFLAGIIAAGVAVQSFLLHDPHFLLENSSSVEVEGNSHLSRAQLLSVFGGDVERNIFRIPLDQRRAQLESLPWIEHATVMRLLPNHVRVAIQERTPVAFVRQGGQIGLVDASGVLLDIAPGTGSSGDSGAGNYSFPVVTGISQADPLSVRAARMHIFVEFLAALNATGEGISRKLSEVDLSNPEDLRAMVPDTVSGNEVLIHFGSEKYLERYHRYQEHLAEWRQQYPKLASVDMRYDQQVVLEMQPGSATSPGAVPADPGANSTDSGAATEPKAAQTGKILPVRHATAVQKPLLLASHEHGRPVPHRSPARKSSTKNSAKTPAITGGKRVGTGQ